MLNELVRIAVVVVRRLVVVDECQRCCFAHEDNAQKQMKNPLTTGGLRIGRRLNRAGLPIREKWGCSLIPAQEAGHISS